VAQNQWMNVMLRQMTLWLELLYFNYDSHKFIFEYFVTNHRAIMLIGIINECIVQSKDGAPQQCGQDSSVFVHIFVPFS